MSRSVKVDQVADAFNTVPGTVIIITAPQPSSDINLAATYTQFWPDSSGSSSFNVPVAGKYLMSFNIPWNSSSTTSLTAKMVFDEGETNEQTVGDGAGWRSRVPTNTYTWSTFWAEVELTAGDHTLKGYAKETVGASLKIIGTGTQQVGDGRVTLRLIGGSGAGGLIVTEATLAADFNSTSGTFEDVDNGGGDALSVTITAAQDEKVLVFLEGYLMHLSGANRVDVNYSIDGTDIPVDGLFAESATTNYSTGLGSYSPVISPALDAGERIIKIQTKVSSNGVDWKQGAKLVVVQYRGGQVPIEAGGVEQTTAPRALNFENASVDVDTTGRANISFNDLTSGIDADVAELAADFVSSSTSFVHIDNGSGDELTVTFDAVAGETVLAIVRATITTSAAAENWLELRLDDVELLETITGITPASSSSGNLSFCYPLTGLSEGSHTVKVYGRTTSGNITVEGSTGDNRGVSNLSIVKFRSGFVQPENVPILEYNTAAVVNVKAGPGASDGLILALNDGRRYRATSPLTVDLSATAGLGALESSVGGESASTFYYIYAVPSDVDYFFDVIGSDQDPDTGPADYTAWRYLGAVFNNASSNLRQWIQYGNIFHYPDPTEAALWLHDNDPSGSRGGTEDTPTASTWYSFTAAGATAAGGYQRNLNKAIPVTVASLIDVAACIDTDSGEEYEFYIESGQVQFTPTNPTVCAEAFVTTETSVRTMNRGYIPLYNDDLYFYWTSNNTGPMNWSVVARGYVDKFLAPRYEAERIKATTVVEAEDTAGSGSERQLTVAETETVFTNEGATAEIHFDLPSAQAGLKFTFIIQDSDGIQVNAAAGDTIRVAGSGCPVAGYIESNTIGNCVTILAINATEWISIYTEGAWAISS